MKKSGFAAGLLAATCLAGAQPALAQADASTGTEAASSSSSPAQDSGDIVVTAQKRSERAQSVPISLSAFNGEQLQAAGILNPGDLQRIAPTFKFTSSIGTLATRFSIRGIGTFGNSAIEPSVASFINGIYIPRPASIINASFDIASVEVLSGPQGTLFGRNASVGALSFRTADPGNTVGGVVRVEASTGERYRGEAAVDLPISDGVAIRVAGLADTFGGYWHSSANNRRFGGIDTYAGRITLRAELSPSVTWRVVGEYQQNKGDGTANTALVPSTLNATTIANLTAAQLGVAPDLVPFDRTNSQYVNGNKVDDDVVNVSSDLSLNTGGGFTVRLLNGYTDWTSRQSDGDTAALANYVLGRDLRYNSEANSHELQLVSPNDLLDGRLGFVGGLYYYHENLGIAADSLNGNDFCDVVIPRISAAAFPGLAGTDTPSRIAACRTYSGPSSTGDFRQSTRSIAAYGQFNLELVPTLTFTGGLRYTDERKTGRYVGTVFNPTGAILAANETTNLALKDNRFTWRANLAWRPTGDVMLFATASTGFKSGGFNNGIATSVLGKARIFQAETVTNYELGIKSQWLNRALTFNATAYRMDINNFQERSIVNTTSTIRNVGSVRNQGVELELVLRPTSNVKFNANIAYLDSNITKYCNAPRPPYLPSLPSPAPTANCPTLSPSTQDLSGARLNYTPAWSGSVGIEIGGKFGGSSIGWRLNGDINFVSDQLMGTTIDNSPLTMQDGYVQLGARATIYGPDEAWSLSVFGRNLSNTGYCSAKVYQVLEGPLGLRFDTDGQPGNDATAIRCLVGAPRVIGVSGSIHF